MEKTRRVKIVTGLKCNIRCVFCYYRDNLRAPNRTFEDIGRDLHYAKKHGICEVDFSGGEPTVHPDLPRLISIAKSMGMGKVCIISNGWRLSDRKYTQSLKESGLDEILFSLHGSKAEVHDELTNTAGSFDRISRALENAFQEGINIRTNTVVNRINYEDLPEISAFVKSFQPAQVNFITINDWCFARHLVDKFMLRYSDMNRKLKESCDLLKDSVRWVNVRYIPFCFMQGYERFVCNHRQVPFDRFEWVPRVRSRLEVQNNLFRYLGILSYGFTAGGAFKNIFKKSFNDILDDCVTEALRRRFYQKRPECKECRFELICDGVEKTYAEKFGLEELAAQDGEIIIDPVQMRR